MAIRVKKLARELRATPEAILVALSDLGYARYKSSMDMVADTAADKVRTLARKHGLPSAARKPAPPPRPREPKVVTPETGPVQAIQREERRLQQRAQALAERERELIRATEQLEAERAVLVREAEASRLEVQALRDELDARARALEALGTGGTPLASLLEERGLRGRDEQGRALEALARSRVLDPLLERLRVVDPVPVARLLRDRLVLASGEAEDLAGVAIVSVPTERAEVPDRAALDALRDGLAGEFLLAGLTKVRIVGGGPVLIRLLRPGLDPRIELDLVPAATRAPDEALADVRGVDAVVLWGVTESAEATAVYEDSVVEVLRVSAEGGLGGLLAAVRDGLMPD